MRGGRSLAALALLCLAGCGQKGPLYLPEPAPQVVPAAPAADAGQEPDKDKDKPGGAPTPATAPPAPPAPAR